MDIFLKAALNSNKKRNQMSFMWISAPKFKALVSDPQLKKCISELFSSYDYSAPPLRNLSFWSKIQFVQFPHG